MKKIILASMLVALAATSSFGAASSLAVLADAGKTVASGTATIGKLSTGDTLAWKTADVGYAIITQHINGVKAFGTSHDSTAITWESVTKGTAHAVPGSSDSGAVTGTGWSVM